MDVKNTSLGELLTYWERRRQTAEEKLRHLYALLGDDAESTPVTTPAVKEPAPPPKTLELPPVPVVAPVQATPAEAADNVVDAAVTTMSQIYALLPTFIAAQSGTFTRREMMDYLESHGLQVGRQKMHHTVSALRKKGVIVEQVADPGASSKYVYAKGPNA